MDSLLDELARKSGCDYVSNLKYEYKTFLSREILYEMENKYSKTQWAEATRYILGNKALFEEDADAFKTLLRLIENKPI